MKIAGFLCAAMLVLGCASGGGAGAPAHRPADARGPCLTVQGGSELRDKDADRTLEELTRGMRLSAEDEALRKPRSMQDVRAVIRRDAVYLFAEAAAFARSLDNLDGRFSEAYLELLLGESQLIGSQILSVQAAWVGNTLRMARASLALEPGGESGSDRGRMLGQLIRLVEEGDKIADALGVVAPKHLARGARVVGQLKAEAPNEMRTLVLLAEMHRLRGEWDAFDAAMKAAEAADRDSPNLRYLRGMEQLDRFRRPDLGADIMRQSLARFPRFVRSQAALVLMAPTPAIALAELQKLKRMNEDHYLVMLLEPTLAADQELLRMESAHAAPR